MVLSGCSPFKTQGPPMLEAANTSSQIVKYNVIRIIDGSTIVVDMNGKEQTIRYAMVEPPNKNDPKLNAHSKKYNETLIQQSDGKVKLILDTAIKSQVKNPGVLIAYVILSNGKIANEEMIRSGLAQVSEGIVSQFKREGKDITEALKKELQIVESTAKKKMIGIWKNHK